jgi:transcriptional regulator with XRE-family HTH domain
MRTTKTAGQKLKAARRAEGISQAELAAHLLCSIRTVTALEMGQTVPRLHTAVAIQTRYGIPASDWLSVQEPAA